MRHPLRKIRYAIANLRAAVGLYVTLRPSGRELIRLAWTGPDARGRRIFARKIRQAVAIAWATAGDYAASPGDVLRRHTFTAAPGADTEALERDAKRKMATCDEPEA